MSINCRLCQLNIGITNLKDNKLLQTQILYCTNIDLSEEDNGQSTKICEVCLENIEAFHNFLLLVRSVDKKLKEEGKSNKDDEDLYVHLFECSDCEKCYTTFQNLQRHSIKVHNTKCWKEDGDIIEQLDCDMTVKIEESITEFGDKSEPSITDNWEKPKSKHYICSKGNCSRIFNTPQKLLEHEMRHDGVKPHLCTVCGKQFITSHALTNHEKVHSDVREFKCSMCDAAYCLQYNLKAHIKVTHEGFRHHCSQCTKVFKSKATLNRHELVHSGEKDFQCEVCPSSFVTIGELKKHQVYHQGLKQFKCDVCPKSFFEKYHLTIHKRRHDGIRPYLCRFEGCNKTYYDCSHLKKHMITKHPTLL